MFIPVPGRLLYADLICVNCRLWIASPCLAFPHSEKELFIPSFPLMRLVICVSMVVCFLRCTKAFFGSPTTTTTSTTTRLIRTTSCNMVLDDSFLNYWNNPSNKQRNYQTTTAITREAKIISLSNPDEDANSRLHHGTLPQGATLLAIGTKLDDFDLDYLKKEQPNVIFVSHPKVNKQKQKHAAQKHTCSTYCVGPCRIYMRLFVPLIIFSLSLQKKRLANHWLNCSRHSLHWNGYTHDRQELTFVHPTVYPKVRHMSPMPRDYSPAHWVNTP